MSTRGPATLAWPPNCSAATPAATRTWYDRRGSRLPLPPPPPGGAGGGPWGFGGLFPPGRAAGVAERSWCYVPLDGVAWRGVAWRGMAWRGVAWRGVAWRATVVLRRIQAARWLGCTWAARWRATAGPSRSFLSVC